MPRSTKGCQQSCARGSGWPTTRVDTRCPASSQALTIARLIDPGAQKKLAVRGIVGLVAMTVLQSASHGMLESMLLQVPATPLSMAELIINGKSEQYRDGLSALALLEQRGLAGKRVAVERNGEIVP